MRPEQNPPTDPDAQMTKREADAKAVTNDLLAQAAKLGPNQYFYAEIPLQMLSSARLSEIAFLLEIDNYYVKRRDGYYVWSGNEGKYIPHRIIVGRVDDTRRDPTKIYDFLEKILDAGDGKRSAEERPGVSSDL